MRKAGKVVSRGFKSIYGASKKGYGVAKSTVQTTTRVVRSDLKTIRNKRPRTHRRVRAFISDPLPIKFDMF